MKDISILIPARHEMFLARTIEDILEHSEADIEINVVLDGEWPNPGVPQHERVNMIYVPESIGQRAGINLACKLSKARYVIKVDAHCSFDQGFDRKMLEAFEQTGDNVTMVPTMRNLWAFDWKCMRCGKKWYQGPTPTACKGGTIKETVNGKTVEKPCPETKNFTRKMMWIAKRRPQSNAYLFDPEPHFQYFRGFNKRPEGQGDISPTMSLQGSAFMLSREKYWELNVCDDETFPSWGSQGIEVACKTWLSGGRVVVNKNTYYAHLFRTQGGDFGFPYPQSGRKVRDAKETARDLFFKNQWEQQILPLSWLLEKFWPVPGWTDNDLAEIKKYDGNVKNKTAT